MEYKITITNHLKALEFFLFFLCLIVGFCCYEACSNGLEKGMLTFFGIFVFISFLPVLYLHIEYYCFNKGTKLEIDIQNKKLIITDKNGKIVSIGFNDLDKVVIYLPPNMFRGSNFQMFPFDQYHYAKIYTKTGNEIVITCLLMRNLLDLKESLEDVEVVKRKSLYASVLMGL